MNNKSSGPPVRPYDPQNSGKPAPDQVHARSLYSYWKRTKPTPNMIALDRPSLEVCNVKRTRTNSPAQALVLLNDIQFVEAARELALNRMQAETTLAKRIDSAWLKVTGVHPSDKETQILEKVYQEQFLIFKEHPENAEKLLQVGVKSLPKDLPKLEAAALTVVCQAILNSDAAIWKR